MPPSGASWVTALVALLGVWGQELLQALGVYPGVFDPRDLLYDAIGVLAAWAVSVLVPEGRRPTANR